MAVLKRFSYDNIVEHNPTAPDPVEGGGGSGGDGLFIIHVTQEGGMGEDASITYHADKTYTEIMDAARDGALPIVYMVSSLGAAGPTNILPCLMFSATGISFSSGIQVIGQPTEYMPVKFKYLSISPSSEVNYMTMDVNLNVYSGGAS